jgi:hypothetical protein
MGCSFVTERRGEEGLGRYLFELVVCHVDESLE